MLRLIFLIALVSCSATDEPKPLTTTKAPPTVTIGTQTWLIHKDTIHYKWSEVNNSLCPSGFRIADRADFAILTPESATKALNPLSSGFYNESGVYIFVPDHYFYWTDSELNADYAFNFMASKSETVESPAPKGQALCIRCIRK